MIYVYLAGPISHWTHREACEWRNQVDRMFYESGVKMTTLDPMRDKEFLKYVGPLPTRHADDPNFERQVFYRDTNDIRRADAVFVNLLGAEKPSIGTIWELGFAYALNKPIIVAMQDSGNPHDHIFIRATTPYIAPTLERALDMLFSVMG